MVVKFYVVTDLSKMCNISSGNSCVGWTTWELHEDYHQDFVWIYINCLHLLRLRTGRI
jgi:hypothetical protein